ncbi:protease complex subunit PrcB family protein [Clostridiaceae bacterium M8S5]|nr:protease complex subunit PrcB family protein [Clostridiaceae bacterium M8S5]
MKMYRLIILTVILSFTMTSIAFAQGIDELRNILNDRSMLKFSLGRSETLIKNSEFEIKYKILTNNLPAEINKWVEENVKAKETSAVKQIGNKKYVYVMQKTNTSGYTLNIQNVIGVKDTLVVKYNTDIPKDVMTAQVISYPHIVFVVEDNNDYNRVLPIKHINIDELEINKDIKYKEVDKFSKEMKAWIEENKELGKLQDIKTIKDKTYVYIMKQVNGIGNNLEISDLYSIGSNLFVNYNNRCTHKGHQKKQINNIFKVVEIEGKANYKKILADSNAVLTEDIEYKVLQYDNYKKEIKTWVEDNKKKAIMLSKKQIGDKTYVFIMGEAPTSGYAIKINDINSKNDSLFVDYSIERMNKDDFVLQVITYPYIVVEIENNKEYKNIINTSKKIQQEYMLDGFTNPDEVK